ncbi:MAG: fibronectin type III domain-containing protein [Treponema sp.]|jgi:hypothetical protein|nr:fibronectin type III domain-containing protein [Treponema sp.]
MKRKLLVSGISGVMLVFAMMLFAGCGDGGDGGNNDVSYMVFFDRGGGGGSAPSSRTVAAGTTITLPGQSDMTAPSGKTFSGWSTGGTRYQAGGSYTVMSDTLFTAQWTDGNSGGGDNNDSNTAPSAPTGVSATAQSSNSVSVSWNAVSGATSYKVYRSGSSSGTYTQVGSPSSASYTDTGLSSSTTYYYKVSAVNSAGESAQSSYASATTSSSSSGNTAPSAPTGVSATAQSSSSVSVSWNAVSGATSYKVYYEIGSSSAKNLAATVYSESYTHNGLSAGTTYYYYIKAVNSYGESDYSQFDYATTSSVAVAGSSSSNAITMSSSGTSGSFPSGLDAVWYKFTKYGSGRLFASDEEYSSTYTSDIVIDVYDSSLNLVYAANGTPLSGIDVGKSGASGTQFVNYIEFTNWSGTYYVRVRPFNNSSSNKGTFALFAP